MTTAAEKKERLLADLADTRRAIVEAANSLPAALQEKPFLGTWSVKDLLAHMIGWDYTNLQAGEAVRAGRVPEFYAHRDRDWAAYNAMLVQKYGMDDFTLLVEALGKSQRALLEAVECISARDLVKDYGVRMRGYKVTIYRLLEAELKDEKVHLEQIRRLAETG